MGIKYICHTSANGIPTETDPMGPDDYGYYIYDSGDIDYLIAPSYEWIEIDSRYDGNGSHLSSLSDNGDNGDDVETVNLPLTLDFMVKTMKG